jgi:uncharacterized protein YkwD
VFFGTLFYFKEPLKSVPAEFRALHSSYVAGFKDKFKEIINATSSSLFDLSKNYIPAIAGTTTLNTQPVQGSINSTTSILGATKTQDVHTDLMPVISNQDVLSPLSVSGIISYTNQERTKVGLPYLSLDTRLSKSAESKLQDMFQNQYFQHISPTGKSVSDLAKNTGYEYIVVGENLALGIFGDDSQVVAAWMASPGHKKNILDSRYTDIGVAVGRGMYQGREQWIVVQHFGKPISACDLPNEDLKKKIESEKVLLGYMEAKITALKEEVDQLTGDAYTAKAVEYNNMVTEYNSDLVVLKKDIDDYNISARVFNTCAGIAE